jgi:hypothetical protein
MFIYLKINKVWFFCSSTVKSDDKTESGKLTCKNSSVVDYCICTCSFLLFVYNFNVLDFCRLYSDVHSPTTYGAKWLWCKIHMVRNGFWLWYEIAILWYEMVNYGTKWQWYEMVMVRNDLLRTSRLIIPRGKFKFEI